MGAGQAADSIYSGYLFDNAAPHTGARFSALSEIFDHGTIRHLRERGIQQGWHCLEVGGGGGSIATWLSGRVGPTGHVLVTDIDTRFLETLHLPNMEVRRHNIAIDSLPQGAFDLVHCRLVLMHLPERERVLERLVAALKPGGWLVDEEFDSLSMPADPGVNPSEVFLKTQSAVSRLLAARGAEPRFGRTLFARLRAHGLIDIAAEARAFMWQGRSAGASLWRANFEQLREDLIGAGYTTKEQFDEDLARLDNPEFLTPSPIMWTAWGRRTLT
ncbi:MAG: methyltransferase [Candidatus Acidiferrum sp.]